MDRMDAAWELHMRDADPPELAYPCPLCLEDACGCDEGETDLGTSEVF